MLDGRRCRIVAVYGGVGNGVYEVRGRKGRGDFLLFSFIGRFVGCGSNGRECDSISINFG